MKKIIAFVLAFLMISGMNTTINCPDKDFNVFAADTDEDYNVDVSIVPSESNVLVGDLFYFDISFSNCRNVYDGSFELSHDKALSFEKYEMLQGLGSVQDDGEKLSIEISKKDGFSNGNVIRLYFRANECSIYSYSVGITNPHFGSSGSCSCDSCNVIVSFF